MQLPGKSADHAVGATAESKRDAWADRWTLTRQGGRGKFLVVGFEGKEAADHMSHLRQIARLWTRYRELDAGR